MTIVLEAPKAVTTSAGRDLDHMVCCDPDTAFCGLDVTDHPWADNGPESLCSVCADLDVCPQCGVSWYADEAPQDVRP